MWVSPNHPDPPKYRDAPRDTGHRLATFPRGRGEELRVSLAEYEGRPYIALRVWAPGIDGQVWPVKGKGVSIRLREVADLAGVLAHVAEQLEAADQPGPADRHGDARGHRGRGTTPAHWRPAAEPFDEFEGTGD